MTTCPLEGQYKTSIPHHALAYLGTESNKDEDTESEKRDLLDSCEAFFEAVTDSSLPSDAAFGLRVLLSHCPPLRATPMVANVLEDRLWSWLTTTNQYLTWKDGTASGVRILHLQGRIEHLSLYSERLFLALQSERSESARRKPIFYFEFRKNDCRFNNTKAMLLSFLTQLATHTSGLSSPKTSRILKFFRQDHVLSLSDLMQLFQRMIFLPESEDILWFVSCVDFCVDDGLEQFIQNLRNLCEMSDIPFQFLVTGSSRESLRGLPIVELDSFLQDFGYQETRSETEILLSRQSLMSDLDTNARQSLSDLLGKFKHDNQLSHMILNWMKSRIEDPLNLDEAFGVIRGCVGLSAVSIYNILAQKVPTELRKLRDTASQLVLVSMQPLRPQELAAAIAIDDTTAHGSFGVAWSCSVKRTLRSLLQVFPGQFILKNNEVHIAHDAIRQELTAVEESALNSHIAKRCLRYLSLPPNLEEMQQMVESLHDAEMALTWPRNSWTAYAVKYFADHYRLSGNLRPVKEAMQFFECRKTGPLWSEAYNAIPNQFGRMDCGYLTALPILARTGLVDLVEAYVNRHKESLRADEAEILPDCWLAAIEASHQGNMPILRILLDKSSLDASQWCRVISAASESGEAQLIHHLIDSSNIGEIQETLEDASWLRQILLRSAWLGHTEIVEKLLKLGVKLDPTGEERHEEDYPLWISIVGGHRKMTKLLLNAEVSQPPSAPRLPDFDVHGIALEQASAKGDPEIVRLLVERASVLFTNAKIDDAIRTACISGCFKALEALLLTSLHTESRLKGSDASEEPWLISAAKRGFLSCARVLLESGANIHMEYSGQTALHVAVNHGSLEMARFFLMHGADPNRTSESIELPLTMAVKKDDLAMVELLLDHGADIEKEDETDEGLTTALASAASIVNDGIFYLLRNRGADINHVGKGSLSRSPIFAAAWRTDPDALGRVTDLIEAGADVNMVSADPDKWTVLHAAYDNPKVLPVLLGTGVDVNQLSGSGSSVLFMAARWGYKDSVTALLNYQYDGHNKIKVDLEFYSEEESELNGMTPLCVASKEGNVEIMRLLLEAGADAVHQSSDGSSPLLLCLRFQHRHDNLDEAVSVILDHIPVTAMSSAMAQIDKNGDTILHAIDCSDSFHVAKRLIHMGADLSARSKDGCTPLMKAIVDGNYDLAAFLVSQGADIHLGSYERGTPLHLACKGANLPLVKLLVDAGADVNKLDDRSGESVLQACMVDESGNLEVAKYLVEERNVNVNLGGGRYVHPLINNSRSRSSYSDDIAELLIKHHADVNAQDVAGRTPIHHCMQAGSWLLDTLLKLGADPEAKDKLGRTALHYAAAAGHDDHVESVLNTGRTGVDTPDLDGWTPLLWSCRGARRLWFEERCELLIKSGASLWARGRGIDGTWSPLKVARYFDMTPKSFHTQLEPDEKHRIAEDGQVETWEDDFHQSKRGWIGAEDLDCSGCFAVSYNRSPSQPFTAAILTIRPLDSLAGGSAGAALTRRSVPDSCCALYATSTKAFCTQTMITSLRILGWNMSLTQIFPKAARRTILTPTRRMTMRPETRLTSPVMFLKTLAVVAKKIQTDFRQDLNLHFSIGPLP